MIICPSCGTENQDHFRFCQGCGTDVSQVPRGTGSHDPAKTDAKMDALDERTMPAPFLQAAAAASAAAASAAATASTSAVEAPPPVAPVSRGAPPCAALAGRC